MVNLSQSTMFQSEEAVLATSSLLTAEITSRLMNAKLVKTISERR
jgi:hypothetical protein